MPSTTPDLFAPEVVRHAYDTVASTYATHLPDTRAEARRTYPDLPFAVASLNDLPFDDDQFAGVLLWYSTIHTAPSGQPAIFAEVARVLQPGGHVLVGFQSGEGVREVVSYRRFGHDVALHRHLFTADEVAAHLAAADLTEVCRMQRAPVGREADGQAMVLARAD